MLNILNPRQQYNKLFCSAFSTSLLDAFFHSAFTHSKHNSTNTHTRDVRHEKNVGNRAGGRAEGPAGGREWRRQKACVNLIVEIKVDTYDDLANSL